MKKKKRIGVLLTVCFLLAAGTLYTVTYIRPWKEEAILLEGNVASAAAVETVIDCAESSPTKEAEDTAPNEIEACFMYVHICGEVKKPGVYEVSKDTRLNDVVTMAGGLTKEAAAEYVNLAQTIVDGQKYFIPSLSDVEGMNPLDTTDSFRADTTDYNTSTGGGEVKAQANTGQTAAGNININTATREELMTLPGVGETKAEAIITYRETVSQFETIEDIMKVDGIKEGLFQKISDRITAR